MSVDTSLSSNHDVFPRFRRYKLAASNKYHGCAVKGSSSCMGNISEPLENASSVSAIHSITQITIRQAILFVIAPVETISMTVLED